MTVQQLREALAAMPGHLPVHLAVRADGSGGGADTDYLFTLECVVENLSSWGNVAAIYPNYEPK